MHQPSAWVTTCGGFPRHDGDKDGEIWTKTVTASCLRWFNHLHLNHTQTADFILVHHDSLSLVHTSHFYRPQRSCGQEKVMFLLVSVILLTRGVCLSACWEGSPPGKEAVHAGKEAPTGKEAVHAGKEAPPREGSSACWEGSIPRERSSACWEGSTPPPANERPVRILLECILVRPVLFTI